MGRFLHFIKTVDCQTSRSQCQINYWSMATCYAKQNYSIARLQSKTLLHSLELVSPLLRRCSLLYESKHRAKECPLITNSEFAATLRNS